jgi:hypothetical protein
VTLLPGGSLTKLSSAGDEVWSTPIVPALINAGMARLAVAPSGEVVMTAPHPGPESTVEGASIRRFDVDGHLRWERHFGETKPDAAPFPTETTAYALALDGSGDAFVAGAFCALTDRPCSVAFGSETLSDDAGGDLFVLDVDDAGTFRWVHQLAVPWSAIPWALVVREDAIFLGGEYSAGFSWGQCDLPGEVGMHGFAAGLVR